MTDEFDINKIGMGVLPDPTDSRDYPYEAIVSASPVDWDHGKRLDAPPDEHQGTSDACVAYSTSYLHWQHKRKNYSRRDIFSRIALSYGAYLRDGVRQICKTGQQTRDECPDPTGPTPHNMRVKSDKPDSAGMDDLESNYFSIFPGNTDLMAQAIRDHRGCIFGVYGSWSTWTDPTNPEPPPNQNEWAHALYAMGYHLHNGQKCIIAKSSWCTPTHNEHHIKQNYFSAGMTFSPWAIVPKDQQNMTNALIVKKGTEYGIYSPATSPDGLITLLRNIGVTPPLDANGQLDFTALETMIQGQVVIN